MRVGRDVGGDMHSASTSSTDTRNLAINRRRKDLRGSLAVRSSKYHHTKGSPSLQQTYLRTPPGCCTLHVDVGTLSVPTLQPCRVLREARFFCGINHKPCCCCELRDERREEKHPADKSRHTCCSHVLRIFYFQRSWAQSRSAACAHTWSIGGTASGTS